MIDLDIFGTKVHTTSYEDTSQRVAEWANLVESRYVCIANVHMVMEAWDSPDFGKIVNSADMVTPDGMPLVWMLRLKGFKKQQRVYGPTLMLHVLERAAQEGIPVGFYGGEPEVLEKLVKCMQGRYPRLNVAYSFSPPFRSLSPDEDDVVCQTIQNSGLRILFIGLGCPKQERWMAEHRNRFSAVMLGVGAAFDFHAGEKSQAPAWMQRLGMEWVFRLFQEPGRLWRRYLIQNPRFVLLALAELLGILKISQGQEGKDA